MIPLHVKIYCKYCGKKLHHERVEIPEPAPEEVKNPLRAYVGISLDPWCEECLGKREDIGQ